MRVLLLVAAVAVVVSLGPARAFAQERETDAAPASATDDRQHKGNGQSPDESKRIFGIIPNYRTSPTLNDYQPLARTEKFKIGVADSFDRGTFALAGLFAADGLLYDSTPAFGHGIGGYGQYYAAAWTDLVVGDMMTESVLPTALRQDPRYFRKGTGSGWSRLGYAVGQIFWTHTDAGGTGFNFSEIGGNAAAVAISNAYYPGSRTWSANATKLELQIGVDMAANILKEFWPDLDRVVSRHRPSLLRQRALAPDRTGVSR